MRQSLVLRLHRISQPSALTHGDCILQERHILRLAVCKRAPSRDLI